MNSNLTPDQATLSEVNYVTSPFTYTALGSGLARNAIGYNPVDNCIYGIEWDDASGNELVRVASDGSSTVVGTVAGLPSANYTSGAISPTGQLYIREGSTNSILYRIDIATLTATAITLSPSFSVQDLAWHNGALYASQWRRSGADRSGNRCCQPHQRGVRTHLSPARSPCAASPTLCWPITHPTSTPSTRSPAPSRG
ncbi:MAG: hypothetical protein LCH68_17385 [Proteobacteria bacterium]|nr:hypothetical protein [Pseudomonadota bacterium]